MRSAFEVAALEVGAERLLGMRCEVGLRPLRALRFEVGRQRLPLRSEVSEADVLLIE